MRSSASQRRGGFPPDYTLMRRLLAANNAYRSLRPSNTFTSHNIINTVVTQDKYIGGFGSGILNNFVCSRNTRNIFNITWIFWSFNYVFYCLPTSIEHITNIFCGFTLFMEIQNNFARKSVDKVSNDKSTRSCVYGLVQRSPALIQFKVLYCFGDVPISKEELLAECFFVLLGGTPALNGSVRFHSIFIPSVLWMWLLRWAPSSR